MKLTGAFVAILVGLLALATGRAETEAARRAAAAGYLLAYGRLSSPAEQTELAETDGMAERVVKLKARLASDPSRFDAVVQRSYRDAFGRPASSEERASVTTPGLTYTELMRAHLRRLAENPEDYEAVIRRAYPVVISRDAYPEEIAYWKKQGTFPFLLLVACLDNWARRNQPGLMVTGGKPTVDSNCSYLVTVRVDPEQLTALRQTPTAGETFGITGAVIAAGGDNLATNGDVAFVAAGSERLGSVLER